jgi:hypothetical protein
MKRIFLVTLFGLAFPLLVNACKIFVTVEGSKKEVYKAGDIVIVKIRIQLEHRNCNVDLNETVINVFGSKITATTKWVNTEGKIWERKIKIKIADDKEDKATITVERSCDRDGGKGSLTLITSS